MKRAARLLASSEMFLAVLLLAVITGCGVKAIPDPSPMDIQPPPTNTPGPMEEPASAAQPTAITPPTQQRPRVQQQTSQPAATAAPPSATVEPPPEPADSFPVPPERNLYRLASELIPGVGEVSRVEGTPAPTLAVGHRQSFELVDLEEMERYQSEFELRLVTPNAYWFVENGLQIDQEDIEKSAAEFENTIYPSITGAFGSEWKPGIDGDPHLYILNAALKSVGGYYSPADEYPKQVRPVSNEIEAIYINAGVPFLSPGSPIYAQVLAHELQHAIHWNADPGETSWVNEGLSELAVTVAGYQEMSVSAFRRAGPTSLTVWPAGDVGSAENYGAASLFMHYLTEHYGGRANLRPLLSQQADGIAGIEAFLENGGYDVRFKDVFQDWAVANFLDEDTGLLGYDEITVVFPLYRGLESGEKIESSIPQYAAEYVRLELPEGSYTLSFEGAAAAPLLPVDVGEGCWWSNNGDDIDSTLTAHADLRDVEQAALDYEVWYTIEEDWDYAYLEVSTDDGKTWQILETAHTSSSNPLSSAFGPGYTGSSDRWLNESVSLNPWAGQEILLRFQYITDAALNDHGLCLRNLRVAAQSGEIAAPLEWQPNGFAWTNNLVRQDFIVQVIYEGRESVDNRVLQLELDDSNLGKMALHPALEARRVVVAVQSIAPSTRMPANYTMRLEAVE